MLCPKCSAATQPDQKRCSSCGVILPRQAPTGSPAQPLAIREGITYLSPTHHYKTPAIDKLSELVGRLMEGEEIFDDLEDHLEDMSESFAEFEEKYATDMQALLAQESTRFPEDDYNLQLSYLLRRGLQLFDEGCRMFEAFFDAESEDADELDAAFRRVREGHDYICLSLELANARLHELQSVMKELESLGEDEEFVLEMIDEE